MIKHNFFIIFLKKINLLINSLLEKYLNKLNFNNLSNIASSNKVFMTFVALIVLFLSYLLVPHVYNKAAIEKELENQLLDKFGLNFNISKEVNYNFFPRPNFTVEDAAILESGLKISDVKKLRIFVSLNNLFSLKGLTIRDVTLNNTNFRLNKKSSNFFIKLLNKNFLEGDFNISDSNIFFLNNEKEVLFINRIKKMKYYYDPKELKNVVFSENEIFNIPYYFSSYNDKAKKKIFSKINFSFLKLQIENELDYFDNNKKKGLINFIYSKNKSQASYELNKNSFNFNFFDKLIDPKFVYQGNTNFNPFYSVIKGKTNKISLINFLKIHSLSTQLLKTEILNNKNLNIDLSIDAKKSALYQNFINIFLNFKIQEGLIDIDNTRFSWKNYVNFKISDSLIYVNKNHLILNGKFLVDIKDYNKIYKFLQISKNLRPKLEKLAFNFNYNFDQQTLDFSDIRIDNQISENVSTVLKKITLKNDKLQNKIYFKNIIKEAIKAYAESG